MKFSGSRVTIMVGLMAIAIASCSGQSNETTDGSSPTGAAPSEVAPMFTVPTTDGTFSLSEHLANDGRPVFLNLWASWCFPCREEMPAIDAAAASHPEVAFIGVSVQDTTAEATAFAEEIGVLYTLGFDEEGTVDASYTPLVLPASFIISPDGVILERIFGKVTEADLDEKFSKHFG
jgi:thiol-disulfide isomerase/thioredoxin